MDFWWDDYHPFPGDLVWLQRQGYCLANYFATVRPGSRVCVVDEGWALMADAVLRNGGRYVPRVGAAQ